MWKKIAESTDLISYEKKTPTLTIRLEARLLDDNSWVIFKKYFNDDGISYTEEYHSKTRDEAYYLIESLKSKVLDRQEIERQKQSRKKGVRIQVRRTFKEYNVEKWDFAVDNEDFINFIYLRFEEMIELDLIVHEKYKIWEQRIITEIMHIFGLAGTELDLCINFFYFKERFDKIVKGRRNSLFIGRIEMGSRGDDFDQEPIY
ncbi:MAG: hypothetical protein QXK37_00935 [Candidatus Woesearchaeota archaeon]